MFHTKAKLFYSSTLWPQVRNGELGETATGTGIGTASDCVPVGDIVLFFGASDIIADTTVTPRAMSRMAVTKPLDLVPGVLGIYSQPYASEGSYMIMYYRY